MKQLFVVFGLALALLVPTGVTFGQLLVQEDFNYTAGTDLSANGWSKAAALASITVAPSGLTYTGYIGSGVGNSAYIADWTDRYSKSISVPTSGNLYAAFTVRVDTATANGGYIVCFYSNNAARGRFWVKNDGSGNLKFGLSGKSSTNVPVYTTANYAFKTTYLVVLKYIINTVTTTDDQYALIVNPLPGKAEPAPVLGPNTDTGSDLTANTAGSALSIQGRDSLGTGAVIFIDGIRVGRTWSNVLPPPPYYYKGSGALEDVANWGDNNDGSGNHPADFGSDGQLYIVMNTSAATLTVPWVVSGVESKVVVGAGTSLTVSSTGILSATVDIGSGGALNLTSADFLPVFGSIVGNVNFDNAAGFTLTQDVTLPASSGYFNLVNGDLNVASYTLTVKGRFRANANKVTGAGKFVLDSAATLAICSPNGITASAASGDIQTTTRTFSRYATYLFTGSANQVTGNAVPDTVVNLSIQMANRSLTVTPSKVIVATGNLNLTSGKFKLGGFNLVFNNPAGQSDSSYVITDGTGALGRPVSTTGVKTMPLGSSTRYMPVKLTYEAVPMLRTVFFRFVGSNPGSSGYPTDVTQHFTEGYWVLKCDSAVGGTFKLDVTVPQPPFADTTKLRIMARPDSATAWTFAGTFGAYASGFLSEPGVASFGQFGIGVGASAPPLTGKRYKDEIFATSQIQSSIQYGAVAQQVLDIHTGTNDTAKNRALLLFVPGGGFKAVNAAGTYSNLICQGFAKRGYVVAYVSYYRTNSSIPTDTVHFETMLKALQDVKAAVRFMRKNAATYNIDTSQIFMTGSSAGSITALHLAYLDSAEVPSWVNWANVGGTFEGLDRGNPGYSSRVHGVLSCWGAIGDTAWMKPGNVPVYSVHGTHDSTVYYDLIPADGPFKFSSKYIFAAAQRKGLTSGLRIFSNTGHTLDNNTTKQDSAYKDMSAWLFTILKPSSVSVEDQSSGLPTTTALMQNYPNPFNPTTAISYQLSAVSQTKLSVYDLLGREVAVLVDGQQQAGHYVVSFDASRVASGVYFYVLRAGDFIQTRKMLLMK